MALRNINLTNNKKYGMLLKEGKNNET